MKKYGLLLLVVAALFASGCGSGAKLSSMGLLPSRMESIDQGGIIPEDYAAKEHERDYKPEMFVGKWVLEGSDNEKIHPTDKMISVPSESGTVQIECLPASLEFNYLSDNEWKERLFENNGVGYGTANFYGEGSLADIIGSKSMIYDTGDGILAVGLINPGISFGLEGETVVDLQDQAVTEIDITEIDYEMSWSGWRLTLSYGEESAVYVPEYIESSIYGKGVRLGDFSRCSVLPGYEPMDGILCCSKESDGTAGELAYDNGEGKIDDYVEAEYEFAQDGTVWIRTADREYKYTYFYAGDTLTLEKDGKRAVYCTKADEPERVSFVSSIDLSALEDMEAATEDFKEDVENYIRENNSHTLSGDIQLSGQRIFLASNGTLSELLSKGFTTDVDISQMLSSCKVSDVLSIYAGDAELRVKVINPYENPVPISDCLICSWIMKDTSGVLKSEDGFQCGASSMEEIKNHYAAPYKESADGLVYKGFVLSNIKIFIGTSFGEQLIEADGEIEITYEFESGILSAIQMERPSLLYNGLQDNVDPIVLADMDQNSFSGVIQVRDSILSEIKQAMDAQGVSVSINQETGEVVMDTEILFAKNAYELTGEGKQYIDTFFNVYASVILDEDFSGAVSGLCFEGHTDTSGSYEYNLTLSQKRADAVSQYCLNLLDAGQREKLQKITKSIGYSFSDPVFTEKGEVDMDASRRVALKFYVNG